MSDVEERVIKVTTKVLGIKWHSEIRSGSNFSLDLGADSLDVTELVMSLEDEFDIEISDIEADNIHTVSEATEYIKERLND
jgi:acyl carrier protein|tara:strand:+ start:3276 stop:3518 length:243 start_codon:yes stop_codon:yes gene_type:complete